MKAIGVLRFVFLGVGIALIPFGIMTLNYNYKGHPAAEIFVLVAMVSLGIALIVAGIGLLIASIVMFVKYHQKSQQLKEKAASTSVENTKSEDKNK